MHFMKCSLEFKGWIFMRLMSPFIFMDKRNFLNGRYVCIAKLQFIPAAFIPALHLVQLQFEQKCTAFICNSVESAMYPFILICVVCGQQKPILFHP